MASRAASRNVPNRWAIAVAGIIMQVALGAVYAWSVFRTPLSEAYGTGATLVNVAFSIAILALGFSAFFGGLWMRQSGPRVVTLASGILYGGGVFLASFSSPSYVLLWLTYGLLAGIGIGLGYIVPIATLVKWFPDRRGFITGLAVAGFGAGAVLTVPLASVLIGAIGVFSTFAVLGILYLIMVVGASFFMQNPPEGWSPPGFDPQQASSGQASVNFDLRGALRTWQWYALWAMLFLNVTAGIAIITEAEPLAGELTGVGGAAAATLVIIISIGNGAGRFLWAWFSDAIGRKWTFLTMYVLQVILFLLIPLGGASFILLAILCIIIASCYGGGFGTMPAFNADYFGSRDVGTIYGLMITAWGLGGVFGPLIISRVIDLTGSYTATFYIIAFILLVSCILPLVVRPPKAEQAGGGQASARVR